MIPACAPACIRSCGSTDHSGKTVTVIVDDTSFQVLHDGAPLKTFPRTVHQKVARHKAYQPRARKGSASSQRTQPVKHQSRLCPRTRHPPNLCTRLCTLVGTPDRRASDRSTDPSTPEPRRGRRSIRWPRGTALRQWKGFRRHPSMTKRLLPPARYPSDMPVIANRRDPYSRPTITGMISGYVSPKGEVIFDHPHNRRYARFPRWNGSPARDQGGSLRTALGLCSA
jgi:hypothetical protein